MDIILDYLPIIVLIAYFGIFVGLYRLKKEGKKITYKEFIDSKEEVDTTVSKPEAGRNPTDLQK